jgi:hypothetical protein
MADMSSVRTVFAGTMVWSTMLPDSSWCVPIYKSGVQQMVLLVVGVMSGFVLGLRFFNVFVLFPAFGLALLGTAAAGIGRGERLGSVILTIVFVGSALQIGYLVGIVTRAVWASLHVLNANVPRKFAHVGGQTTGPALPKARAVSAPS